MMQSRGLFGRGRDPPVTFNIYLMISALSSPQLVHLTVQYFSLKIKKKKETGRVESSQARPLTDNVRDVGGERQQVIKMLILVVVLFLLCWGPR